MIQDSFRTEAILAQLLTEDGEWTFFVEFIVSFRGRGGRPARDHQRVLDGIFWIARTGAQSCDLSEDFGKW